MGFRPVGSPPACHPSYRVSALPPACLTPAEHISLFWTHNRTCSRVGGWRGLGLCRGSYVLADNRRRPFPSAPLRTARESFDLKQLASGLCVERVPFGPFLMNGLVAPSADDQGLAAARRHPLDPGRLLVLAWSVQIRQLVDVVNLTGPLGATQLAFLSQKALHHLTPNTEDFLGMVVEDGVLLSAQLDAPEA